ncbi:uncharacterized protein I303_103312 [Kwoniella dejecticola CBS 10117]|uniref:Uncharacterized protein n=1 Tax=Kwoniella dejecticola CBS 10117 TaxID=1296121 RepID=A0A1A6A6E0_9TREE|nr:uncharacterized protein I303_03335 [Kwoniella dejecticola CBS 10117]OBR85624.1 hypothetical protein I303_03335 [Kwoniella dejecticola CBS 10117]
MTCIVSPPSKASHPALLVGLTTPPLTPLPTSPATHGRHNTLPATPKLQPPEPSYAMLRAHHAYALKYMIAKLRWDQVNNLYIPGQDADWNHNEMLHKLEKELQDVKEAQKGLDKFPNCFAPIAFPKPHGPVTKEKFEELEKIKAEKEKKINEEMEKHFEPFLRRMFIGPLTKLQAKRDFLLREQLKDNDLEDVSMLIPTENKRYILAQNEKRMHAHAHAYAHRPGHGPAPPRDKKSYEQQRYEKEKIRVALQLEKIAKEKAAKEKENPPKKRIGPMTKEEWVATLPQYGPRTYQEAMLPKQRAQRHDIITWLQRPWGRYNEKASKAMEVLAELAKEGLEEERMYREKLKQKKEQMKILEKKKAQEDAAKKREGKDKEEKGTSAEGEGGKAKDETKKEDGKEEGEPVKKEKVDKDQA